LPNLQNAGLQQQSSESENRLNQLTVELQDLKQKHSALGRNFEKVSKNGKSQEIQLIN